LAWHLEETSALPYLLCELSAEADGAVLARATYPCQSIAANPLYLPDSSSLSVCAKVSARIAGTEAVLVESDSQCFTEAELQTVERREPELVNFSACKNPSEYASHPLNAANAKSADSGCSLSPAARGSWPQGLLLLLAGLLLWGVRLGSLERKHPHF
jgi:hypothetical protein